jgi:hypothetical protein
VLGKRKAESEPDYNQVVNTGNIWSDFADHMKGF